MSIYFVLSVREELSLIICKVGKLLIFIGLGENCSYQICYNNIHRCQASLALLWAVMKSVSVELPAVID